MSEIPGRSRPVGPVHRAFGLLQVVVAAGEPVGVRDLARRSGLSRSTTGRMLGLLAELGMVERTADGATIPGAGLAGLTALAGRSTAVLRHRVQPVASELMREFGENAAIGVDDGAAFLYLVSSRHDTAVQVPDPVDGRFDFHLVAPGLVAMTAWRENRVAEYLATKLAAPTVHSVIDPDRIGVRLDRIRSDGFAWTDQELDLEVNGLAAPIVSAARKMVAVATLYGPSYRLNSESCPTLGPALAAFVTDRARMLT